MKKQTVLLTDEEIKTLPTPRLLAWYKKHKHLRSAYLTKEWDGYDTKEDIQKNKEMNVYMDKVKAELDTREHIL